MTRDRYTALVPQGLDDADRLIYGRTPGDILIYLAVPMSTCFLLTILDFIPVVFFGAATLINLIVTVVLYRKAGTGTTVTEYLQAKIHRLQLPQYVPADREAVSVAAEDRRPLLPDGGNLAEVISDVTTDPRKIEVWEDETDASEFTRVRAVYPQFDVIQRDDGTYITAVEISGTNLYMRSRAERSSLVEQFASALRELEFEHQVFITTRDFDVQAHATAHAENAAHDDIASNPILQELHEEYQKEVLDDRRIRQTRERTVYGIIKYEPGDDRTENGGPSDITAGSEADLKRRQEAIDRLNARQSKYISVLSNIADVSVAPVDYETHLGELAGHWETPLGADPIEVPASPIVPPAEDTAEGSNTVQN